MPPLDKKTQKENSEVSAQLNFIKAVFDQKLPVYLIGGYADDALLHQKVARTHHDVDLIARRADAQLLKTEVEKLGYKVKAESRARREKPYKLTVKGKNLIADIGLLDSDDTGELFTTSTNPTTGEQVEVRFDKEIFDQQPSQLGEIIVNTVSPLELIRSKDAYFQVGLQPSRQNDVIAKDTLIKKFYPNEDPTADKFKLRIRKIG